jgi:putative acetyltransferase
VKIRPATEADIPDLAQVAVASYRASFVTIVGEDTLKARSLPYFEKRFGEQLWSLRLAQAASDRLIGFNQVRDGKLDMLFLHPDFFGMGFGAALLADAEERGATRLDCFQDNFSARRFYERHVWRLDATFRQEFAGREFDSVTYLKP